MISHVHKKGMMGHKSIDEVWYRLGYIRSCLYVHQVIGMKHVYPSASHHNTSLCITRLHQHMTSRRIIDMHTCVVLHQDHVSYHIQSPSSHLGQQGP